MYRSPHRMTNLSNDFNILNNSLLYVSEIWLVFEFQTTKRTRVQYVKKEFHTAEKIPSYTSFFPSSRIFQVYALFMYELVVEKLFGTRFVFIGSRKAMLFFLYFHGENGYWKTRMYGIKDYARTRYRIIYRVYPVSTRASEIYTGLEMNIILLR